MRPALRPPYTISKEIAEAMEGIHQRFHAVGFLPVDVSGAYDAPFATLQDRAPGRHSPLWRKGQAGRSLGRPEADRFTSKAGDEPGSR
jgi:hypothetical protein